MRQTKDMTSLAEPNPPPGEDSGDGRPADFIIADLKLKSLKFTSPITLLREKNNPVPVPQVTCDQNGHLLTANPFAYVRNTKPNFTFDLWNITGDATMGFTFDLGELPNTDDGEVTLYQTPGTDPEAFTSPATRAAQNPLLDKVVRYRTLMHTFNFYVKFTLPGTWSGPISSGPTYLFNYLYGLLGTPTAPMAQPWVQVVDDACIWALGTADATDATTKLTKGLYDSAFYDFNREYDTTGDPETFYLGDFLNGTTTTEQGYENLPPMKGECNDFADFLVCLSNALGARPLKAQKSSTKDPPQGFWTHPITGAHNQTGNPAPTFFFYHQFGNDNTIFDAAVRWQGTITPADVAGPAENSDYFNGTVDTTRPPYVWNPLPPFTPIIENHRP